MRDELFELHARLESDHWWFRARREILWTVVTDFVPPGGDRVLVEVGCGTGGNVAFFSRGYRCIGIDPAPAAVEAARRLYPQCEFVQGLAPRDLPEHARRADLFLMADVLEHVDDDAGLLRDIASRAKPRARLVLTVPADPTLWSSHDVAYGHRRRYEREHLASLLTSVPLRIDVLSYFNSRLYPLVWLVRRAERLLGRDLSGAQLRLPPGPINRTLYRVFRGEKDRLARVARNGPGRSYSRGLSLLAVCTHRGTEAP